MSALLTRKNTIATPMLKLKTPATGAEIWVKMESMNRSGSSKERICAAIIEDAERRDLIRPGVSTIVEATSGNTGIALSYICASRNYGTVLFMPENVTEEKKSIARAYGAQISETPAEESVPGAVSRAGEFAAGDKTRLFTDQFSNPLNPRTHALETAREIIEQMEIIDAFVMGVGTGGTITGAGREIKKRFPGARVVAVEPAASAVLSGGKPGTHSISGIGTGFVPEVLDTDVYDEVRVITDKEAWSAARKLARANGLLAGPSSGANYAAAMAVAREMGRGARVVTIVCDSGDRYPARSN